LIGDCSTSGCAIKTACCSYASTSICCNS
jgi:hypothetical protein